MNRIISWFKAFNHHFIDDCNLWYKKWSTWLAFLWGFVGVLFWNIPNWLPQIVTSLPPEVRALLSPVVLAVMSGLPILISNLKQKKLEDAAAKKLQEGKQQ
jgi:ABC-type antimicrobial peptide transport system permease subunit